MLGAAEALERLKDGNRRFVSGEQARAIAASRMPRADLVAGQNPFAVILGCSDSRVPAEIVFDQGLGDLFVIRVAGNIVAPSQIASVEFAAEQLGTRLVVVMGHTHCGAVSATLQEIREPSGNESNNLPSIVNRIRPAVEPLLNADPAPADLLGEAMRANVRESVRQLRDGSATLAKLMRDEGLAILGAAYDIESGVVDFFDAPMPR